MVIQLLANGVVAGCVYGLIALGFGLIYSTTKKKRGHPLAGRSRSTDLPVKRIFFFPLFFFSHSP